MCDLHSKFATGSWLLPLGVAVLFVGRFTGSEMAQTGALSGVVTNVDTGDPIEVALVMAREDGMGGPQLGRRVGAGSSGGGQGALHAVSDDTGADLLEDLEPGDYVVAYGKIGYAVARETLRILEGQNTFDFALEPVAFGAVAGLVTDASMAPIPGDRVVLTTPLSGDLGSPNGDSGTGTGGGIGLNALTGDDGTHPIDNVPVGDYAAVTMAFRYTTSEPFPVTVAEGVTTEGVDFAIEPMTFGGLEGATVVAFQHVPGMRPPPALGPFGRWCGCT